MGGWHGLPRRLRLAMWLYMATGEAHNASPEAMPPKTEALRGSAIIAGATFDLVESNPFSLWSAGAGADSVPRSWWIEPTAKDVAGTKDPELYRYGVHAPEFTAYVTVGPGTYKATLRLVAASERQVDYAKNRITVFINDRKVIEDLDVAARAGGTDRALDLDFPDLTPLHGTIAIRLVGTAKSPDGKPVPGQAFIQAIQIEPQPAR